MTTSSPAFAVRLSAEDAPRPRGRRCAPQDRTPASHRSGGRQVTSVVRYSMSRYLDVLLAESPDVVVSVAEGCRRKLQTPRVTREDYIGLLVRDGW